MTSDQHHHIMRIRKRQQPQTRFFFFITNEKRIATVLLLLLMVVVVGAFILFNIRNFHPTQNNNNNNNDSNSNNSLFFNQQNRQWLRQRPEPRENWITTLSQPFNTNGVAAKAKHLIIVAGHSVTIAGHLEDANQDEADWFLLPYQKHRGMPDAFVAHIQGGIQEAQADPASLLVFSGGQTRALTGPLSEGSSYYRVADAMNLWPTTPENNNNKKNGTVRARTVAEEFATDSFENLLFSICRFREVTGAYPEKITMVSFTFKQRRFETMHAQALRWPASRFHYVGLDPPASAGFDLAAATNGEYQNAAKPFEEDPYGCHSEILQQKRKQRNPFSRTPPYSLSCPEMKDLLQYCGPELIDPAKVPWKNLR